ncbi:MAG: hypothetical protein PUB84_02240 [Bacteroidales bacterium]|nr:hypothetical protein [Bacteroidales bacterium]MDD6500948.1 hypothetical protein [Bacteroidales bacterium]MDD6554581.1 hypothetical protein [Bacteroidales bacterium]MDD6774197.1 hypothetical protein [Bacteroidales bacterium]
MSHFLALSDILLAFLEKKTQNVGNAGWQTLPNKTFTASILLFTKKAISLKQKTISLKQKTASVSSSNGEIDAVFVLWEKLLGICH